MEISSWTCGTGHPAQTARTAAAIGDTFARLDVASEADWSRIVIGHPTCAIVVNNADVTGLDPRADAPLPPHDPEHAASPTDKRCTR